MSIRLSRLGIVGLVSVIAVTSVAVVSALADDSGTFPCPDEGVIPQGSICAMKTVPVEGTNITAEHLEVVYYAQAKPPCDRAPAPEGAIASTCRVVDTVKDSDSAMVAYSTPSGGEIRVWVLGGGKQLLVLRDSS